MLVGVTSGVKREKKFFFLLKLRTENKYSHRLYRGTTQRQRLRVNCNKINKNKKAAEKSAE